MTWEFLCVQRVIKSLKTKMYTYMKKYENVLHENVQV